LAVLVTWCDASWDIQEVCAYVKALPAPRTGEAYHGAFVEALEAVGLEATDVLAGLSDHEGAVRKGLRLLGVPLVGCGCHAALALPRRSRSA
jgi:hypothetical protein